MIIDDDRAIGLINSLHQWYEFQSQVQSYQRLKKWYLMPLCLTLSTIK